MSELVRDKQKTVSGMIQKKKQKRSRRMSGRERNTERITSCVLFGDVLIDKKIRQKDSRILETNFHCGMPE